VTGEDIHTLVGAYALDAVDDVERARFDRHLATCPSCAQELAELRATAGRLADLTEAAPPARLRAAVLAEVARTPQARAGRPARTTEARWRRWTAAAVAAGIIAIGAAAATYVVEDQRVRDAQAQAAQVTSILEAPDAVMHTTGMAGGRVTVVTSASLDKGVALLNGLDGPGPRSAYQLWVIKGTQPTSAGVLATGSGDGTKVFGGVRGADAFGVSHERAGGAGTPTVPLVGTLNL
jgi:Anti-sigma-K factor rskA, C-terminal/Putative zinc-finger